VVQEAQMKTLAELQAEFWAIREADKRRNREAQMARLRKVPAEVVEFPSKELAEADRQRQWEVAEQDRLRREHYQRLCDEAWQRNLDRWAEEARRHSGGFHRGYGDADWPA
jgi:hypothetical protein